MRRTTRLWGLRLLFVALVAVASTACGGGDKKLTAESLVALAPQDVATVAYFELGPLRKQDGFSATMARLQNDWPFSKALGVDLADTNAVGWLSTGTDQMYVVSGLSSLYDDLRRELTGSNYEKADYRGFELWTKSTGDWPAVALLDGGNVLMSDDSDSAKAMLRELDRGGQTAGAPWTDLVKEMKTSPIWTATSSCPYLNCQMLAVTLEDGGDSGVASTLRGLFDTGAHAKAAATDFASGLSISGDFQHIQSQPSGETVVVTFDWDWTAFNSEISFNPYGAL